MRLIKGLIHRLVVIVSAFGLTLLFFIVLPLIQTISAQGRADALVQDTGYFEPPPPPPQIEQEEPEEQEPEEEKPELDDPQEDLTLAEMDTLLGGDAGFGGASLPGVNPMDMLDEAGGLEGIDMAGFDQEPRVIYQASPRMTGEIRRRAPGTVFVVFVVNERGQVEDPKIQQSPHPAMSRAALDAIKKWKFEPARRGGEPAPWRMRVPITFKK
jgi:protein TonB